MAWTYLKFTPEGDYLPGERSKLPPPRTAFLAFDAFRWGVRIGYRERGGCISILDPNVNDDCRLLAFAPLSETTEPDQEKLRNSGIGFRCPIYDHSGMELLR